MSRQIPIRLTEKQIARIDRLAEHLGSNRSAVIKMCTQLFLERFERDKFASLPVDWDSILLQLDNRTRESKRASKYPEAKTVNLQVAEDQGQNTVIQKSKKVRKKKRSD